MSASACVACGAAVEAAGRLRYGRFLACPACRTLFDPRGATFAYDKGYFEDRGHDPRDEGMRRAKVSTFRGFWGKLGRVAGPVLEVGCSAGFGLVAAREVGLDPYGLDVVPEARELARALGVDPGRVVLGLGDLTAGLRFGAVAFFDSFEHVPDPRRFFAELAPRLAPDARLILVLPAPDTPSRRVLGRLWPHFLPDHWVHYSRAGLTALLSEQGFTPDATFFPTKHVSVAMIVRHVQHKFGLRSAASGLGCGGLHLRFNIGERGYIFARRGGGGGGGSGGA